MNHESRAGKSIFDTLRPGDLKLPHNIALPPDCYTRVTVRAGNAYSSTVFFAHADAPGPCQHPWNLTTEQLTRLDAGEAISTAQFTVWPPSPYFQPALVSHVRAEFVRREPWEIGRVESFGSTIALTAGSPPKREP